MFCKKILLMSLLMGIMVMLSADSGLAYGMTDSESYQNAYAFYQAHGTSKLFFHDGNIYYASRGVAGDEDGIRYGVCGQCFTLKTDDGNILKCVIALDQGEGGSCKRISYITKDGYRYSLYRISYELLFQRFQDRYPDVNFSEIMYNQRLLLYADFYLCLVIDGEDQGKVLEGSKGNYRFTGTVYQFYEEIMKAAEWSSSTKRALEHYYGIQISVFQSSSYWVRFMKNKDGAGGRMPDQLVTYGEKVLLNQNLYASTCKVTLYCGLMGKMIDTAKFPMGYKLNGESCCFQVSEAFAGWAERPMGTIIYHDQEEIMNLTKKHKAVVPLYAVWKPACYELPDIMDTDLFRTSHDTETDWDSLEFLGWSYGPKEIMAAGTKRDEVEGCMATGNSILVNGDLKLYGVWAYREVRLKWEKTDAGRSKVADYYYPIATIKRVRRMIRKKGGMSRSLFRALIKGGLA